MLEVRPNCEHCGKDLPNTSTEAMICSFECTYCKECALEIFENVCPTCSGNFVSRPIRPQKFIEKYPASTKRVFDKKNIEKARLNSDKYKSIVPEKR
ncbi:DUF1272 domain-containing protein [Tenacibaculum caenipelagi]|uniref:DUF1272 domain-containing protein n=1 Tax=Tenacibaculum caenipelagi TaxID=1325435 RepID=A0A4R6TCV1_9FLAO|nr:DUF1272 domain-containing protein [Tenacibaculum caenipelagi]TDQ25624.1 hypothetical protein DFQ07_2049 [Tenacibaculum caenipelagi]